MAKALFFINAFFLGVGLLNVIPNKNFSYIPTLIGFAILTTMFFVISKTPKKSKRIFGRATGMRKWLFVILCLLALYSLPRLATVILGFASNITIESGITTSNRYATVSSSSSSDYVYDVVLTGGAIITDYVGTSKSITIPSELDDHPVIKIADRAFEDCTSLESISMWADITEFGEYAFVGCINLRSISIPSSTKRIGAHAFEGCTSLSSVTFWNAGIIEEYAFAGCNSLTSISIPTDTSMIGAHAFDSCTGLTSLTIWDAEIIDEYAFYGCSGITSISFPSETKEIRAHAFDGCTGLTRITLWNDEICIDETAFANCPNLKLK